MNWYKIAQINEGRIKVLPDSSFMVLGKNTKQNEGPWRISRLNEWKTPITHRDFETYEDAEAVFNYTAGKEKNVYELV